MNTAQTSPSNWAALLSGANGVRSLALAGGVVLHAINVYIATTILPSVVQDIGGIDYYAWNTTLFVAASILGSSLSARLLGRLGPRGAYLVASLVFAIGALACAFAPSMAAVMAGSNGNRFRASRKVASMVRGSRPDRMISLASGRTPERRSVCGVPATM